MEMSLAISRGAITVIEKTAIMNKVDIHFLAKKMQELKDNAEGRPWVDVYHDLQNLVYLINKTLSEEQRHLEGLRGN